jgi:hypothetical protein
MVKNLISSKEIDILNIDKNKLLLLNGINSIANEVVLNNENKEKIIGLLMQKINNKENLKSFSDNQKRSIIETGLTIALNIISTEALKQEKKIIQKQNTINQNIFLKKYTEELNELQIKIKKNKEDFLELKNNSKNLNLNSLANKINEFHNPNSEIEISDKEIDNLLNGGTIEF